MTSHIIGTGSALPKQIITNTDLLLRMGLDKDEIKKKTGIVTRHWIKEGETTATLAIDAAKKAMQSADLTPTEMDLMVVSTSSPDMFFPSVACLVQKAISCRSIPAFDINASCTGFLYALSIGNQYIRNGLAKNALILSSEVKSVYLSPKSAQTTSLFGDGAGAVVLSGSRRGRTIRSINVFSGGPPKQLIYLPDGGSRSPLSLHSFENDLHTMKMEGTRLFRLAVKKMEEAVFSLLKENTISLKDIDLFIFHQANLRILETVLKKLKIPPEKHHTTIQKFGNTSSSSLPIALDDAIHFGSLHRGKKVALFAFGGGFTWGSALIDW